MLHVGLPQHAIERAPGIVRIGRQDDPFSLQIARVEYGGLHTGKYHRALRELAKRRGALLRSHAAVANTAQAYLAERLERLERLRSALDEVSRLAEADQLPDVQLKAEGLKISPLDADVPDAAEALRERAVRAVSHEGDQCDRARCDPRS